MRRAAMVNRAILWAVVASIAVTRGVAIFFLISLGAFTISLVDFAREVRIALSEYDHHG